jgi:hypothetical protein
MMLIFLFTLAAAVAAGYFIGVLKVENELERDRADELEMSCMAGDLLDKYMESQTKVWRLARALAQIHMECGYEHGEARGAVREIERGGKLKLRKIEGVH